MHNRKHQISTPATPEDATGPSSAEVQRPDPEVVPSAKRLSFSKAEKLRILAAADACAAPGDIGALLRREGIYSSHLATWRKQRQLDANGVANPTALVDDYDKTTVNFGDKVPTIASTALDKNGNPLQQVSYQQSGVVLNVTPRVLGAGKINLSIDGQVSSFSATTTGVTSSPTLSNRQIQTSLTMNDGEILIIGGLSSNKSAASSTGISFLPKSWSLPSSSSSKTDLVLVLAVQIQN